MPTFLCRKIKRLGRIKSLILSYIEIYPHFLLGMIFSIEKPALDTNAGKNCLKLPQMSNKHWC
jgi:hypothetical protein